MSIWIPVMNPWIASFLSNYRVIIINLHCISKGYLNDSVSRAIIDFFIVIMSNKCLWCKERSCRKLLVTTTLYYSKKLIQLIFSASLKIRKSQKINSKSWKKTLFCFSLSKYNVKFSKSIDISLPWIRKKNLYT